MYIDSEKDMIKMSVIAGGLFGLAMGIFMTLANGSLLEGIIYWLLTGILFGGVVLIFSLIQYKSFKKKNIDFIAGKKVLAKGCANHTMGRESVGGFLLLTEDSLIFQSHKINIQNHSTVIPINEIIDIKKVNSLGIIPNGLNIVTNNSVEKYVVYNREGWVDMLNKCKGQQRN